MSSLNALFLITHLSALSSKCSIYDIPCLSSMTQIYATTVIPGGTGYGIETLDPMIIDIISGDQDGLIYEMSDIEIVGIKHTLVDKVQFNKDQKKSNIKVRIPNLTIFSNYTVKGFLNSVPFNGDGKLIFQLFDLEFDITMNYENTIMEKDGKEHIKYLREYTYWYDMRYAEAFIENVNKDDPARAIEAQGVINHKIRSLWQQYGRRLFDRVTERMVETVRKVMLSIPAEHILADYE